MKLGISAFAWTSAFEEQDFAILPFSKSCGYEAVEIPMFDPANLPAARLRRKLEACDLKGTVCAILPPGINPIDPGPEVRKAAHGHLRTCIEVAAELGASLLGGPLYAPIGYLPPHRVTADEKKYAVEAFQSVTDALEIHGMTLALEPVNRSESFFLRTSAEAAELCAAIGHARVGVTIDTFHANIEEKSLSACLSQLAGTLRHVHVSENDRGILGSGHVDFKQMVQMLATEKYDGYLMVEGFGFPAQGRPAPGLLLADPAITPERFARESYLYLQTLMKDL